MQTKSEKCTANYKYVWLHCKIIPLFLTKIILSKICFTFLFLENSFLLSSLLVIQLFCSSPQRYFPFLDLLCFSDLMKIRI